MYAKPIPVQTKVHFIFFFFHFLALEYDMGVLS